VIVSALSVLRSRRGVALAMVLLMLGLLTAVVAAGLALNSVEGRVNDDTVARSDAFALAQSGLQQFLVYRDSLGFTSVPPAVMESTRVTLTQGYADVVLQQIRPAIGTDPALYALRASGVRTAGSFPGAPNPRATVAELVRFNTGIVIPPAGWTSLTGITKSGGSGALSGVNNCGSPVDTIGGVAVPTPPGYSQSGGTSVPYGTPNIQNLGGSYATAAATVPINWGAVTDGSLFPGDYTIPGASWNSTWFGGSNWPVIRVNNDPGSSFNLPTDGRGILIVTGSLGITGSNTWNGLIMVGRTITISGNATINGALFTGLNLLTSSNPDSLGAAIGASDVGSGTKTIRYDACALASALSGSKGLQPLPNAWTGDWRTY
jgi:hypothetical protein